MTRWPAFCHCWTHCVENLTKWITATGAKNNRDGTCRTADPLFIATPRPAHRLTVAGLKPAAVLLPLVERADGLQLLLTRRSPHLRHHAGQISFPGGRQDPDDRDLIHTALRETQEELGIVPAQIEVLGTLTPSTPSPNTTCCRCWGWSRPTISSP